MLYFLLEKTGDQNKTVLVTTAAMAAMACDHDVVRLFEVGMVIYPSDSVVGDKVLTKMLP